MRRLCDGDGAAYYVGIMCGVETSADCARQAYRAMGPIKSVAVATAD